MLFLIFFLMIPSPTGDNGVTQTPRFGSHRPCERWSWSALRIWTTIDSLLVLVLTRCRTWVKADLLLRKHWQHYQRRCPWRVQCLRKWDTTLSPDIRVNQPQPVLHVLLCQQRTLHCIPRCCLHKKDNHEVEMGPPSSAPAPSKGNVCTFWSSSQQWRLSQSDLVQHEAWYEILYVQIQTILAITFSNLESPSN